MACQIAPRGAEMARPFYIPQCRSIPRKIISHLRYLFTDPKKVNLPAITANPSLEWDLGGIAQFQPQDHI